MNWFSGSIPEAIGLAKSTDAVFVVYVYDSSEASTSTDSTLAEEELATVLSSKKFVAIKLENGTDGAKQFSQIYPVVVLPSLYFISGSTGMPLEILGGAVSKEKLKEKLDQFTKGATAAPAQATSNHLPKEPCEAAPEKMEVEEGDASATNTSTANASIVNASIANTSTANSSIANASTANASTATVADSISSMSEPQEKIPNDAESMSEDVDDPDVPLEDKVERAKVLLAEKQAREAEEKAQNSCHDPDVPLKEERRKEVERRKMGQEVAKRKRQMYEEEVQTAARERKKEKDDDRAARERVRAQIAADRLERETRASLLQGETPAPIQDPSANIAPAAASSSSNSNATITRLKFRLPDGSSSIAQFPVEATLSEVRQHVQQTLVSSSSFALSSTVHQGAFTTEDNNASLSDLGLVPSAIIVVLVNSRSSGGGGVVSSQGGIIQLLLYILSPITFLWGFIRQIFGGNSGPRSSSSEQTTGGGSSTGTASQQRPQRPSTSYGRQRLNREGIHRLQNSNDDDDNNTWNGNSTQQM